jgi:tripartite-type tricarboxylate transporter receptor subunit TctC
VACIDYCSGLEGRASRRGARKRGTLPRAAQSILVTAAWLTVFAGIAQGQTFPVRPLRIIVPFAPGGATDILARLVAQKLTEGLGQQAIVENRAGGGSVIGTEIVAKSPPDGYTLLMTSTSTVTNPSLLRKLPFDTLRDLAAVTELVSSPNVLVVHPSLPVKSVRELIALARAKPGQIAFGSGGNGTSTHLGGEILPLMAGVRMVHVPFKGTAPATIAVMSGEISWEFGAILAVVPHIRSGRLRAIAVSSAQRASVLPEVPPVADTLPGFEASPWTGVSVPAGTSKEVIAKLHQAIAKGFTAPETRERLAQDGNEVVVSTPEQFDAFFRAQMEKWAKVIKDAGIRLE